MTHDSENNKPKKLAASTMAKPGNKKTAKGTLYWTPERKAELRKLMPKKLNKYGEWFFSEAGGKPYLIINDEEAVLE